jgi:hypothetical protein
MKKQQSIHDSSKALLTENEDFQSQARLLGSFFHLLLRIDKRVNPGLYESNKDRNRSYTPEGGPDGFRIGRD